MHSAECTRALHVCAPAARAPLRRAHLCHDPQPLLGHAAVGNGADAGRGGGRLNRGDGLDRLHGTWQQPAGSRAHCRVGQQLHARGAAARVVGGAQWQHQLRRPAGTREAGRQTREGQDMMVGKLSEWADRTSAWWQKPGGRGGGCKLAHLCLAAGTHGSNVVGAVAAAKGATWAGVSE